MLLVASWQGYHAWNTHERVCRAGLAADRPHYMWNYLSCVTESCATDRHGEFNLTKSILPNQSYQINLGKIIPSPRKLGKIDQCGTSQFNFYIGGTYIPSPTCHTPSPTCQKQGIGQFKQWTACSRKPEI